MLVAVIATNIIIVELCKISDILGFNYTRYNEFC